MSANPTTEFKRDSSQQRAQPPTRRRKGLNSPFQQGRVAAIFLTPALLAIAIFVVYPAIFAFYLSLTNASLIRREWGMVGLDNYLRFLGDPAALHVLRNTYFYVFTVIVFQFLIGLGLALALNSVKRGRGIYGALLFLPWVFSEIMAVTAFKWIFNDTYGLLNYYLQLIGLPAFKWFATPNLAMGTVIVLNVWKGYPFSMVLLLAGLQSIPHELYEAASIDGANRWAALRHITFPLLWPVMLATWVLITIYTFNIFSLVYAMTGGGPVNATEIIGLFMYRTAFTSGRLGYGASVAVLMFLLNLLITVFYIITLRPRSVQA